MVFKKENLTRIPLLKLFCLKIGFIHIFLLPKPIPKHHYVTKPFLMSKYLLQHRLTLFYTSDTIEKKLFKIQAYPLFEC